ncbi:MAG: GNAT family N-acetyltransferase [Candidatus Bathyarchaeota archaeon]
MPTDTHNTREHIDVKNKMVTFSHGGDIEELRTHLESLGLGLGATEERLIGEKPERLILWRDNDVLVGHAIWHVSNTKQHPGGEPRGLEDRRILEDDLNVVGDFIELHEIWLSDDYRGRGYGSRFFEFFEDMVKEMGYDAVVYYADHPAAMSICLRRGYSQSFGVELDGITGERARYYVLAKQL